ncbi:DUF3592 domain-containing protein [Nocardia sp. NPDC050406]|uniref:DUF3592 domain-containing protein n=1 Tax=Nocardia sp. NPDC050406 TaxID=3364318 RepID=UPI00379574A4
MSSDWWYALIPLGVGSVFFVVGVVHIRRTRTLRRSGAKAYGQVVRLATSAGENGTLYHPVVRWVTQDGYTVERSAAVGKSWIVNFRPGTQVLVHYDPADPDRMVIEGYSSGSEWLFCFLGAAVVVGTVAVVAGFAF